MFACRGWSWGFFLAAQGASYPHPTPFWLFTVVISRPWGWAGVAVCYLEIVPGFKVKQITGNLRRRQRARVRKDAEGGGRDGVMVGMREVPLSVSPTIISTSAWHAHHLGPSVRALCNLPRHFAR